MRLSMFAFFVASALLARGARAELPPYAGSHDDASYGEMTHTTFAADADAAPIAVGAAHDDVTYASVPRAAFEPGAFPVGSTLTPGSQYDDVAYATERPSATPQPARSGARSERLACSCGA